MPLSPREREDLAKRNLAWLAERRRRREHKGGSYKATIARLYEKYYSAQGEQKAAIRAAKDVGVDERKLVGKSMTKAQKLAAKELGIRGFNGMTKTELDEAINLATGIASGNLPSIEVGRSRLEELQKLSRERTKARFAAMKAKKGKKSE